jgi:hypothetical protein
MYSGTMKYFIYTIQIGFGAHPDSYPMGNGSFSPGEGGREEAVA